MKIIIDAMGGDHAPAEILKGAAQAVKEYHVSIVAVGNAEKIAQAVKEHSIDMDQITIVNASEEISMCDEPTAAIRHKNCLLYTSQGESFHPVPRPRNGAHQPWSGRAQTFCRGSAGRCGGKTAQA